METSLDHLNNPFQHFKAKHDCLRDLSKDKCVCMYVYAYVRILIKQYMYICSSITYLQLYVYKCGCVTFCNPSAKAAFKRWVIPVKLRSL
jgi:hypothetical protein